MKDEKAAFGMPEVLADLPTHYCPGCQHGVAQRLVAECLDELDLAEKAICIGSIGCSVFIYNYLMVDAVEAPHGRAPAVATGVKRSRPESVVFTYQGDGDLASIGLAEIMHCANRGERVSIIFVNNTVYGMTGGQMAPTSIIGQKTTSSPQGRDAMQSGHPIQMSELLAGLAGSAYVVRRSLHDPANIRKAKKAIVTALKVQQAGLGFSLVELLSTCPTNWGLSPADSLEWVKTHMLPIYPVGDFKVADGVKEVVRDGVR